MTKEEDAEILRLRSQYMPYAKIARIMGRSKGGVYERFRLLTDRPHRFTPKDNPASRFSKEEDEKIVRRLLAGASFHNIATELQRGRPSIVNRYFYARLYTLDPALPPPTLPGFYDPNVGREIVSRFMRGEVLKDIAHELNLPRKRVENYATIHGVERTKIRQFSEVECQQIVHFKSIGWTFKQIATRLERHPKLIARKHKLLCADQSAVGRCPPESNKKWTSEQLHELMAMHESGCNPSEMAGRLGRSVGAIYARLLDIRRASSKVAVKVSQSRSKLAKTEDLDPSIPDVKMTEGSERRDSEPAICNPKQE